MHSESGNIKIMFSDEADDVIKKRFMHFKIEIKIF